MKPKDVQVENIIGRVELPKGWVWTMLGEMIDKIPLTGRKLKQSEYQEEGKFPVIDQGQAFIGGHTDREELKVCCEQPLIIFGDHTKVVKYVDFDFVAGADGVKVLEPLKAFYPKLLYYFIQMVPLPDKGYARHFQFVEKSAIPLPPLAEQQRIVAKIEELFTELDVGVEALQKVKAQLKRYRQAVLKHAFEGKLTEEWRAAHKGELEPASLLLERIKAERAKNVRTSRARAPRPYTVDTSSLPELPEGWVWTYGDTIFSFVTSGSRGWAKYYSSSGSIFLRIGNLNHDSISLDLTQVQRVHPTSGAEGSRTRVIGGDILISITADVGMVALVPEDFEEAYVNQHVALARSVSTMNKSYLAWFLASREGGQGQFLKTQRGATKMGLGLDDIRGISIPLPPLAEQHQIVEEIERRLSITHEIEKVIEQSLKQAERLRHSILKMAFEGKLVPQDLNDEPADKLLERIKQAKSKL